MKYFLHISHGGVSENFEFESEDARAKFLSEIKFDLGEIDYTFSVS